MDYTIMKRITNIFVFVLFSLSANKVLATGNMIPVPFSKDPGAFVVVPAAIGFGAGGVVGAVVGIPVAAVASVGAIALDKRVSDTAQFFFWGSAAVGGVIGGAIVGAPFWVVKQVFYDLPIKAFEAMGPQEEPAKV